MKDFLRYFSDGAILASSILLLIAIIACNNLIFYAGIFVGTIMLRSLVDVIIN